MGYGVNPEVTPGVMKVRLCSDRADVSPLRPPCKDPAGYMEREITLGSHPPPKLLYNPEEVCLGCWLLK